MVTMMFDATPADAQPGVIVGFVEDANGIEACRLALAERQERVIKHAERALGRPGDRAIGYVDLDWSAEEWTRGCYGAHFPPGLGPSLGPAL
jgi:monoamine oxidase